MVTENGGIKSSAKFDKKLYTQINRTNFICCIVILVTGVVGLIFMVTMHCIAPNAEDILLIVCSSVLTVAGLFILIMTFVNIKKGANAGKSNITEVYSDHFIAIEYERGVKVGDTKVYFNTLYRCKESKDYFFAYVTRNAVHPIGKEGLTPAERIAIRNIMRLPQRTELISQTAVPPEALKASEQGLEVNTEQQYSAVKEHVQESVNVFEDFPDNKEGE